ncbi:MAG: PP0621 family protein [Sulfurimonas sp.]|nr:PP0621 family protein [Sulfurimonas sp.]
MFIKKKPTSVEQATSKKDDIKASDMVECEVCGVYIEVSESILSNAKYYCSKECIEKVS